MDCQCYKCHKAHSSACYHFLLLKACLLSLSCLSQLDEVRSALICCATLLTTCCLALFRGPQFQRHSRQSMLCTSVQPCDRLLWLGHNMQCTHAGILQHSTTGGQGTCHVASVRSMLYIGHVCCKKETLAVNIELSKVSFIHRGWSDTCPRM